MIHQLIFASPKPGMSEKEFLDYWINVHAVEYARKIPGIKNYLIDARVETDAVGNDPLYSGVAEIWFENEKDQMTSLQSKEFLQGARIDEPNWAAFWKTLVLDTDSRVLFRDVSSVSDSECVKQITLLKRKEGIPLAVFRSCCMEVHGKLCSEIPKLNKYIQCHARDSLYTVGEPRFDCVEMMWFKNLRCLEEAKKSHQFKQAAQNMGEFVEEKYLFVMNVQEHWIIN